MDRYVILNLNILMSSANKDDLREGFNASEPHTPHPECLSSTQTVRRAPCKPEAIVFTSYQGSKRSGGERVSDTSAPRPPSLFQTVKPDPSGWRDKDAPQALQSFSVVLLGGPAAFCCVTGWALRPVATRHDVPRLAGVMSEALVGGQRSLCGTLASLRLKKMLPHLGSEVSFLHFAAHRGSWGKPDPLMGRCHSSVLKRNKSMEKHNDCEPTLLKKQRR